jgi:hypothetical protein
MHAVKDDDSGRKSVQAGLAPADPELPRDAMYEEVVKSGWETYLLGIPLIALLLIGVFRLDELILKPKNKPRRQPPPPRGVDKDGREILSDPDGKPQRRRGRN